MHVSIDFTKNIIERDWNWATLIILCDIDFMSINLFHSFFPLPQSKLHKVNNFDFLMLFSSFYNHFFILLWWWLFSFSIRNVQMPAQNFLCICYHISSMRYRQKVPLKNKKLLIIKIEKEIFNFFLTEFLNRIIFEAAEITIMDETFAFWKIIHVGGCLDVM